MSDNSHRDTLSLSANGFLTSFSDARSVFNWRFLVLFFSLFFRFYSNLSRVSGTYKSFITLTLLWRYNWTLHGSKVSRESDLCNVPYNRPVGVRSFVKNVISLNENQHNSWTVQDNSMKLHRLTQLVKMCVVDCISFSNHFSSKSRSRSMFNRILLWLYFITDLIKRSKGSNPKWPRRQIHALIEHISSISVTESECREGRDVFCNGCILKLSLAYNGNLEKKRAFVLTKLFQKLWIFVQAFHLDWLSWQLERAKTEWKEHRKKKLI